MLAAVLVYALARRIRARHELAVVPVEVFRELCPDCGHVEDHPVAGTAVARMAVHRAADHTTPTLETR